LGRRLVGNWGGENGVGGDRAHALSCRNALGGPNKAAEPSRAGLSRAEPSRAEPSRAEPSRAEPSRTEPSRTGPKQTYSNYVVYRITIPDVVQK
jgi:hypothetical protein